MFNHGSIIPDWRLEETEESWNPEAGGRPVGDDEQSHDLGAYEWPSFPHDDFEFFIGHGGNVELCSQFAGKDQARTFLI